jgi:type I restriction enzyme, S subunit
MNGHLPEGWARTDLGSLIHGFEAGRNLRSKGRPASGNEVGVLKISAVTWGAFRPEENKALLASDHPKAHERVRQGDLLISRANTSDLVGAVVIVEGDYPNLMLPDKILRLLVRDEVCPRFVMYALRTRDVRRYFSKEATGTSDSMRNLSQPKMERAQFNLAPRAEQDRIVEKIDNLLEHVDSIAKRMTRLSRLIGPDDVPGIRPTKLSEAVLEKAFSGELVPTEADLALAEGREYEPAEALLERIKSDIPASPKRAMKRTSKHRTATA